MFAAASRSFVLDPDIPDALIALVECIGPRNESNSDCLLANPCRLDILNTANAEKRRRSLGQGRQPGCNKCGMGAVCNCCPALFSIGNNRLAAIGRRDCRQAENPTFAELAEDMIQVQKRTEKRSEQKDDGLVAQNVRLVYSTNR